MASPSSFEEAGPAVNFSTPTLPAAEPISWKLMTDSEEYLNILETRHAALVAGKVAPRPRVPLPPGLILQLGTHPPIVACTSILIFKL